MKNFYVIFLTFVFFTSNVFGYSCYFGPYSGDIRVADINDRQIYTLFTSHLEGEGNELRNIFLQSDIDIITSVYEFYNEHRSRIEPEKSDFRQISRLLTSQKIDWIGVEATPEYIQILKQGLKQEHGEMKDYLYGFWDQEVADDLLYLLYHVWMKLLLEYPNDITLDGTDTNKVRVIPLEDETFLARGELRTEERIQRHREIVQEMRNESKKNDGLTIPEQISAFNEFTFNHPGFLDTSILIDPSDTEEFFTTNKIENPEVIRKIRDYVDFQNEVTIAQQQRDDFVVQSILAQEGNGLVLRGLAHQKYVENALTQACLESRGF